MKIKELTIRNYKSLIQFEMRNIPDIVVIAGGQGTGKSSVLEAIAYFKENVGAYYGWHIPGVVNTKAPFAEISIKFGVYPDEISYLQDVLNIRLQSNELAGYIKIAKDGRIVDNRPENGLYQLLQLYDRRNFPQLGIFEYFNPYRVIRRKDLTGIFIGGFSDPEEKRRRIANVEEKFSLTKDYLAQLALNDLQKIHERVKRDDGRVGFQDVGDSLEPIKKVFNEILGPKEFVGVDFSTSPIRFIVRTPQGEVDIDDLSSGEKEILFTFTELLKLKLRNSIILFDEPDLHLNQEVERKIVSQFKNIGPNNQFWIATHSFGVMDSVDYDQLFRLDNYSGLNQITRVFDDKEKYKTFKAVAGDVGIITLGERIVFLEGVEGADKFILSTLFSYYKGKITFVSSGPVSDVMGISQKIMDLLRISSKFNFFFAIRDRDFLTDDQRRRLVETGNGRLFLWSKYQIENYLLNFDMIHEVLARNFAQNPCSNSSDVFEKIKEAAVENRDKFVSKMVNFALNAEIESFRFKVGFPNVEKQAIAKAEEMTKKLASILSSENVSAVVRSKEKEFDEMITNGRWTDVLPGRDLLNLFLGKYAHGLAYEQFKNQLVNEMKARKAIPPEMQEVINKILSISWQ